MTQGIPLHTGLILLTWQKLAPLSILFQIHELLNPYIIISSAIISTLIGAWNGLNQTQIRKIIAYSSIAHMGWIVSALPFNPNLTFLNLLIYVVFTIPIFLIFNQYSSTSINSLSLSWNKIPILLPLASIILLSIGGLPPLTGFLPKWLIINELLKNNSLILATIMAIIALINLFFYTRIIYSTSLTTFPTNNNLKILSHHINYKNYSSLSPLTILSTLTLPLAPLLFL